MEALRTCLTKQNTETLGICQILPENMLMFNRLDGAIPKLIYTQKLFIKIYFSTEQFYFVYLCKYLFSSWIELPAMSVVERVLWFVLRSQWAEGALHVLSPWDILSSCPMEHCILVTVESHLLVELVHSLFVLRSMYGETHTDTHREQTNEGPNKCVEWDWESAHLSHHFKTVSIPNFTSFEKNQQQNQTKQNFNAKGKKTLIKKHLECVDGCLSENSNKK